MNDLAASRGVSPQSTGAAPQAAGNRTQERLSDVPEQLSISSPNGHLILSNVFCTAFRLARVKH